MNPFIKKEIRLLLPALLIGCGLGVADVFLDWYHFIGWLSTVPLLICLAMAVMIALNSFGAEVGAGTFTLLLAQPVTRQKIWQTKITLLAVALLIMGFAWLAPEYFWLKFLNPNGDLGPLWGGFEWMLLSFLVIFSGALWTVLLLRQVAAAFWFTVLVPGVIFVIFSALMDGDNDSFIYGFMVIALGIYSLGGIFFARWLFMRAQDVQWSGGTIVMPEMRGTPAWLSSLTAWRLTHPRTALWRKEFQLQQSQFIMAFVLVILHLGVIVIRKLGHFRTNSTTEFILENFWMLWLVLPCLVGCAAVAEERKLGTLESHLCLPVKRRTQFAIKLSVVVILSILFGVAMPLLFEGRLIFPDVVSFVMVFSIGVGLIGLVSFFVSTQARNTLQALAPAVAYIFLFVFSMADAARQDFHYHPLWRGDLIYIVGIPVTLLTLLRLAYRNFQQVGIGWKTWSSNLLIVTASLVMAATLTTAAYHRAWEKLVPFEPRHGPARLTLSNPASLTQQFDGAFVRLPDGQIWIGSWFQPDVPGRGSRLFGDLKIETQPGIFLPGSGWKMAGRMPLELVGIKDDGTLWVSDKPWPIGRADHRSLEDIMKTPRHLVQFGKETNWSDFQSVFPSALLIKTDGTLWRWEPTNFAAYHKQWRGLGTFIPYRVGTESNWAGFVNSGNEGFLRKTDGSFWTANQSPIANIVPIRNTGTVLIGGLMQMGIRTNGTLCCWTERHYMQIRTNWVGTVAEWTGRDLSIGHDSNWVAVASSDWKLVTLKDDGTLWLWDFTPNFNRSLALDQRTYESMNPVRLGTHSDWIAIMSGEGYIVSLAADGSLWYWPMEEEWPRYYRENQRSEPLFDYSRKPQLLGNVFAASATLKANE
ncbi:MAG TPA: hypothetical protein VGI03_06030 [Verrucomicrobiae bacterium]|jgi:ABC-type transport system involved in multi-copper enzyme maturation permease subunit